MSIDDDFGSDEEEKDDFDEWVALGVERIISGQCVSDHAIDSTGGSSAPARLLSEQLASHGQLKDLLKA